MKAWSAVWYRLANMSGVYSLIGGQGNVARIYPLRMPDAPTDANFPAVVFKQLHSQRVQGVYVDPGHAHVAVELSCYAKDYTSAKGLAEQVRLALERYGSWPSGLQVNGVTVYDMLLDNDADDFDATLLAYKVTMELTVIHAE